MHLVDVSLHLELVVVVQKMVDIGDNIGESLEEKKDENWDNECNVTSGRMLTISLS
jgi:hypothetical protein